MTPKQALRSVKLHQMRRLAAREALSQAQLDARACREWCQEYDEQHGLRYRVEILSGEKRNDYTAHMSWIR